MLRRSFVLLVLVMIAGLWTPPQNTRAQTGCSERVCKVFLPLVSTQGTVEIFIRQREYFKLDRCDFLFCGIITNTSPYTLTDVQAKHSDETQPTVSIEQTTLAPAETTTWEVHIIKDDPSDPDCFDDPSAPNVTFRAWGRIHNP